MGAKAAPSTDAVIATVTSMPLIQIIVRHWASILMQILYQSWFAIFFYAMVAWVPSYLKDNGVSAVLSQAIVLTILPGHTVSQLIAGWAADRGLHVLPSTAALALTATAAAFGVCAIILKCSLAAIWVSLVLMMALIGLQPALIPVVGIGLYPADCRASGFNFAYNVAFGLLGGLTPMAITAIQLSPAIISTFGAGSIFALPIWISAGCGATVLGCGLLMLTKPQASFTRDNWAKRGMDSRAAAVSSSQVL